jgi:hypothetical protein
MKNSDGRTFIRRFFNVKNLLREFSRMTGMTEEEDWNSFRDMRVQILMISAFSSSPT